MSEETDPYDEDALLQEARRGDQHAQGVLFSEHRGAALAFARSLTRDGSAEDLVSDSFQRVFEAMRAGGGPQKSFRQYLLTTVRRMHIDAVRATSRRELSVGGAEEIQQYGDRPVVVDAGAESLAEGDLVRRAFATLPERWQVVLWRTTVEGKSLQDVADELGMKPNAVAQLSFRAREGLRTGYLGEHAADAARPECRSIATDLARWIRGGLSPRRSGQVEEHVAGCLGCAAAVEQLSRMNSDLGAVLLVSVPLTAAPLAGLASGPVSQLAKGRHLRRGLLGAAAAAVVAVALAAILLRSGDDAAPVSSEPFVPAPGQTLTASVPPTPSTTPSATPTVTPSRPAPAASPAPSPAPSPAAKPSVLFAQGPRQLPQADVRVVAVTSGPVPGADSSWHHIAFSVRAPAGTALRLSLGIAGSTGVEVHHDLPFGRWYCTPSVPGNGTTPCSLSRTSPSDDFALDVRTVSGAGVTISVQPVDARDPVPGNNTRGTTVS